MTVNEEVIYLNCCLSNLLPSLVVGRSSVKLLFGQIFALIDFKHEVILKYLLVLFLALQAP